MLSTTKGSLGWAEYIFSFRWVETSGEGNQKSLVEIFCLFLGFKKTSISKKMSAREKKDPEMEPEPAVGFSRFCQETR